MRNKKADLSLSINAIVILILAITMLGLGLGFIRGMFGKVSTSFEEMVSQEQDPTPATEGAPLTFSKDQIIAKKGETKPLKISAYCFTPAACTLSLGISGTDCTNNVDFSPGINISSKSIQGLTSGIFSVLLTPKTTANKQIVVCTVTTNNNGGTVQASKDFFVKISGVTGGIAT